MKNNIVLHLFLSMFPLLVIPQEQNPVINRRIDQYKIESPNAASFNKYIDHPIDLYAGTPDISIPIFVLVDNEVKIPITLRYNTSGIKVDEESSWVGLGWNLNVGGIITRSVIGGIDSYERSHLDNRDYYAQAMEIIDVEKFQNDDHVKGPWSEAVRNAFDWYLRDPNSRKMLKEGRYDPDIFYYSYPGGNGKFVINLAKGEIIILDRQDNTQIKPVLGSAQDNKGVRFNENNYLIGFDIITTEGIIHRFDFFDAVVSGTPGSFMTSGETYLLTKSTHNNGQVVSYEYTSRLFNKYIYQQTAKGVLNWRRSSNIVVSGVDSSIGGKSALSLTETDFIPYVYTNIPFMAGREFYLEKITTNNYSVIFEHSSREDIPQGVKLDKIIINNKDKNHSKKFEFVYSYSKDNSSLAGWSKQIVNRKDWTDDHFIKRLWLEAVDINGEKYSFTYNNPSQIPRKDSFASDYWGYYNGVISNNSFVSNMDYLMYEDFYGSLSTKIRYFQNELKKQSPTIAMANRASDFDSTEKGMLRSIQYPTGGVTDFVYESNSFTGHIIPTVNDTKSNPVSNKLTLYDDNSFFAPDDLYPSPKNSFFRFDEDIIVNFLIILRRGYPNRDKIRWSEMANFKAYIHEGPTQVDIGVELRNKCYDQHIKEVNYGEAKIDELSFEKTMKVKKGAGYFVVDFPNDLGLQNSGAGIIYLYISYQLPVNIDSEESEGAGVRIKEIISYENKEKKNKLLHTQYDYSDPEKGLSSGILHIAPQMYNIYYNTHDILGHYKQNHSSNCQFSYDIGVAVSDKVELTKDICGINPYQTISNVGYSFITKKEVDNTGNNSVVIYKYNNKKPKRQELAPQLNDPINGRPLEIVYKDHSQKIVKQEKYNYVKYILKYHSGFTFYDPLDVMRDIVSRPTKPNSLSYLQMGKTSEGTGPLVCLEYPSGAVLLNNGRYGHDAYEGNYLNYDRLRMIQYPVNSYGVVLNSKEITLDNVTSKEEYVYNKLTLQLKERKVYNSMNDILHYKYYYPNCFNCVIYSEMTSRNLIGNPVEEQIFRNNYYIGGTFTTYKTYTKSGNQFIRPYQRYFSEIKEKKSNGHTFDCIAPDKNFFPTVNISYEDYDCFGNVIYSIENGSKVFYLWSYNGLYPIARIENTALNNIETAVKSAFGGISIDTLSKSNSITLAQIENFRKHTSLSDALITTYTYRPLLGMLTSTDPNGVTTSYEYDSFGRLQYIKDHNSKVIEEYNYHYKP